MPEYSRWPSQAAGGNLNVYDMKLCTGQCMASCYGQLYYGLWHISIPSRSNRLSTLWSMHFFLLYNSTLVTVILDYVVILSFHPLICCLFPSASPLLLESFLVFLFLSARSCLACSQSFLVQLNHLRRHDPSHTNFSRLDDYLTPPKVRQALGANERAGTWQSCNQEVYTHLLDEGCDPCAVWQVAVSSLALKTRCLQTCSSSVTKLDFLPDSCPS